MYEYRSDEVASGAYIRVVNLDSVKERETCKRIASRREKHANNAFYKLCSASSSNLKPVLNLVIHVVRLNFEQHSSLSTFSDQPTLTGRPTHTNSYNSLYCSSFS